MLTVNQNKKIYWREGSATYVYLFFGSDTTSIKLIIITHQIFGHMSNIAPEALSGTRNELIIGATCRLIANTITLTEIGLEGRSSFPNWQKVIDQGVKHRSTAVQDSAAAALASVSSLVDCSPTVTR